MLNFLLPNAFKFVRPNFLFPKKHSTKRISTESTDETNYKLYLDVRYRQPDMKLKIRLKLGR